MSKFMKRAEELRMDPNVHYNCAQSVLIPFAEDKGISMNVANMISANFGSGMKMAGTCGAITGGLMALGLYGVEDKQDIMAFYRALRAKHDGYLDCANLLRINKEKGGTQKPHCDGMVYECVELVETMLKDKGII